MAMVIRQFSVQLINLDPTTGHEIQKTRPCVIVSPDEMNTGLKTVLIAPLTSKKHLYPTRVPCLFQEREGEIVLDQIRAVDKNRIIKELGHIHEKEQVEVTALLLAMFRK